ncbi:MAG: FecR family protein [Sphingobacterium sp.]
MKDDHIDWDKLLEQLNAKEHQNMDELSKEEVDMLLFSEEVRFKLRKKQANEQFPVQEGKLEFSRRKKRHRLLQFLPYAAALLICLGAGIWMLNRNTPAMDTAKQSVWAGNPAKKITLQRADGEKIAIDAQHRQLDENGNTVLINNGEISYLGQKSTQRSTAKLALNRLDVPYGLQTKVVLADGTTVWVNSGTSFSYPIPFSADKREVYVEGEAYFDVAHDPKKPFVVHCGKVGITVLGTAFGVNTFDGAVVTALVRGKVELKVNGQLQQLMPGNVGKYNIESDKLYLSDDPIRDWVAWKDHVLYFDDMKLGEIAERLKRLYDYHFIFDDPALKELRFTIDIEQTAAIQTVLKYLQASVQNVDFKVVGRDIHVIEVK